MKKFKALLLLPVVLLTSCNKQLVDLGLNYYSRVHVFSVNKCYNINSWTDYSDGDQIQVDITGSGKVLFHSNQIALIEKDCPFCGH